MARASRIEIVERIVRNLPISGKITWKFTDTDYGRIRFAYGKDASGRYHGLWAFDDDEGKPMVARPVEFTNTSNNTPKSVAKELVQDAMMMLGSMHIRGMTKREWWAAKSKNART